MQKELVTISRVTLDVYKYKLDGITTYEFNATECSPPEPMVNTVLVLDKIKTQNEQLIVTFFHEPTPLYERVASKFSYDPLELENGDVQVTFRRKL